jgi:hypothetical protein
MQAGQLDFSLRVAVCAWCKPRGPVNEGVLLSHGICPRHRRKVESEMELQADPPRRRRRRSPSASDDQEMLHL